jgi:chemosensory pili system protein ChpA (sensor histidine kinase/response regulator)
MNAATDFSDFDIGPLTWVKGEIELALGRVAEALQQFQARKEATQVKFARTHLQQAHGALTMVGLDGVTQFVDALNLLLVNLERDGASGHPVDVANEGLDALRQYLDDLLAGEPNQPLRLLPFYQKIVAASGKTANPVDLFFPDLTRRLPKRARSALSQNDLHELIHHERNRFQKGLLAWLRQPENSPASQAGLEQMRQALKRIESVQSLSSVRAFWWAAFGLVTALAHGANKVGDARSLCARIDQQIRRLLQGNPGIAERLLRDCLYFVARTPGQADPLLAEIQSTYRLSRLIPSTPLVTVASGAQETALRRLKEAVMAAEEQWNRFCAGSATSLAAFTGQTHAAAHFVADLDVRLKTLIEVLAATANWLTQDPSRHSDGLAMEIATALLLVQSALENYTHLGNDFGQSAQVMVARLKASVAGHSLSDSDAPLLDEMSRRAQEKMLMAQVALEIQNNLAQIEQVLDAYFRDPSKRPTADSLEGLLRQVGGALSILGQDDAVVWLNDCERKIIGFTKPDNAAGQEDFEDVAQQLSALSLFIDTLQNGKANFREYLERYFQSQQAEEEETQEEEESPVASVENQLERLKTEIRQLLAEIQARPGDTVLLDELLARLDELQKDAGLVADQELLAQAKTALAGLSEHYGEMSRIEAVTEALGPMGAPATVPAASSETLQLAQAGIEELDAELLAIFLEEAREVLTSMSDNLLLLRQHLHDTEILTTIRRGVHTLKGSGRMVGLKDLGETAWAVEQTLNLWLRQEALATPELLELIELTYQVFDVWVNALSSGEARVPNPAALIAKAEALRGHESVSSAAAPAAPESVVAVPPPAPKAVPEPEQVVVSESGTGAVSEAGNDEIPEELQASRTDFSLLGMDTEDPLEAPGLSDALEAEEARAPALETPPDADQLPEAIAPSESESEPLSITTSQGVVISPQLYEIFRDEARGHLDTLQHFLSMLAQSTGMETPLEVSRAAHTLAGIAGTVGIASINKLAHELETALLRRDDSEHPEAQEGLEILQQSVDTLEDMQETLASGHTPKAQPALIDALALLYPPALEEESAAVSESSAASAPATPPTPLVVAASSAQEEDHPDADLLEIFLEEAQDLTSGFYEAISAWRNDKAGSDAPHALARVLHTFKGGARMAGATHLGDATHRLEDRVRELEKRGQISDEDLEDIEAALDILAQSVERYRDGDFGIPVLPESARVSAPPPVEDAPRAEAQALPDRWVAPEIPLREIESHAPVEQAPAPVDAEETDALLAAATSNFSDELPADAPPVVLQPMVRDAVELVEALDITPDREARAVAELPLLQDELDEQLLPVFLEEATELIDGFSVQIAAWRVDRTGSEAPHALKRLLHTFKGGARMAGAMNLGELTHAIESRVDELVAHAESGIRDEDLDEIASACDTLAQSVEHYRSGDTQSSLAAPQTPPLIAQPTAPEHAEPVTPAAATDAASLATEVISPAAAPRHEVGHAQLRVRADLIDDLVNEAGELSIARARIEGEMREIKMSLYELTENVIRLRRQLREIEIQAETQIQANTGQDSKADFDPLELDRFTRFQELTRMMAESVNDVATVQQNLLKNLDDANAAIIAQARLNRGLQQSLMSVRMVPFASQSERLYRLVRQTAKEMGKRASLDIHGSQVEMDRSVLEKILSPLEHMLRNAVAHGLESREARLAAGKPDVGEITLSLSQEGNEIILALSDDGAGIDIPRIRAKAESAGLVTPGQVMTDQQLIDFIFSSGFTTAASVSQVAGRGVGMDVVKTEVAALGGRIEIQTLQGKGTTFRLYLPLTLAVTQVVLIQAGGRFYAVPSAMVEQVVEVQERVINDMRDKGEAVWQGRRYPFHYLPHLLGDTQSLLEQRRLYWVMLLRSGTQRVGILIDEMIGNQEIVVKNVGPQMARVVGISGATVLGDGRVVLILNPVALAGRMSASAAVITAQGTQQAAASTVDATPVVLDAVPAIRHQPVVMVVDDSLTVRKITSKLLVREGYQVELAKDGVDALERLAEFMPDVILSDIEMPRMDGFDLVRNIRTDHRLDKVPIIMITSRTADKHRSLAMEIGANHYLGKPYDEAELLRLLADHTKR